MNQGCCSAAGHKTRPQRLLSESRYSRTGLDAPWRHSPMQSRSDSWRSPVQATVSLMRQQACIGGGPVQAADPLGSASLVRRQACLGSRPVQATVHTHEQTCVVGSPIAAAALFCFGISAVLSNMMLRCKTMLPLHMPHVA